MLPHLIRYSDLFVEWKVKNTLLKMLWNYLIINPSIVIAKFLDNIEPLRIFAMHTTSYGYKPK